jgi:hypothetical protein
MRWSTNFIGPRREADIAYEEPTSLDRLLVEAAKRLVMGRL